MEYQTALQILALFNQAGLLHGAVTTLAGYDSPELVIEDRYSRTIEFNLSANTMTGTKKVLCNESEHWSGQKTVTFLQNVVVTESNIKTFLGGVC